jgi:hypothetical protein
MALLIIFILLLLGSLLLAFTIRASWTFSLPALIMLLMLFWLLFAAP